MSERSRRTPRCRRHGHALKASARGLDGWQRAHDDPRLLAARRAALGGLAAHGARGGLLAGARLAAAAELPALGRARGLSGRGAAPRVHGVGLDGGGLLRGDGGARGRRCAGGARQWTHGPPRRPAAAPRPPRASAAAATECAPSFPRVAPWRRARRRACGASCSAAGPRWGRVGCPARRCARTPRSTCSSTPSAAPRLQPRPSHGWPQPSATGAARVSRLAAAPPTSGVGRARWRMSGCSRAAPRPCTTGGRAPPPPACARASRPS